MTHNYFSYIKLKTQKKRGPNVIFQSHNFPVDLWDTAKELSIRGTREKDTEGKTAGGNVFTIHLLQRECTRAQLRHKNKPQAASLSLS